MMMKLPTFGLTRRLRSKLTVLYASLFGLALALIFTAVYAAVTHNAERVVRDELAATGTVYDRIWAMRSKELRDNAGVLSRDFGFRAAVATGDRPTITSALDNLRARLGIDTAFVIGLDGRLIAAGQPGPVDLSPGVLKAIEGQDSASGVFLLGGRPYQGVSVPVMAPALTGWVVFAAKLDRAEMASLERLSAIPLQPSVLVQKPGAPWSGGPSAQERAAISRYLAGAPARKGAPGGQLVTRVDNAIAVVKSLRPMDPAARVVLVLRYPLDAAFAPYRPLLGVIIAVGVLGLVLLIAGSWALARTVTRPIDALKDAAQRLQRGDAARVEVQGGDEIASLGRSFNAMADGIHEREAALELARDKAEAANRAKSSFLANMSHEVRTPLNGVLGIAGVLAATELDARQREMLGIMENSARMLQRVLSDVLDLARVEAGRLDIVREPFNLKQAVGALATGAEIQAGGKGLGFGLEIPPDADAEVLGDRVRLEQILGNLLSNALKFTEAGDIRLRVAHDDEGADTFLFEVRDSGIGFDPELAETLFEPFQQADGSITRRFGGTGLGLSIARDLARAMGGDLWATGAPGQGAVFTLRLPLPACAAAAPAPEIAPEIAPNIAPEITSKREPADHVAEEVAEPGAERPLRILVADDNETNRTVVQLILAATGAELVSVENGAEAVDAFTAQSFDAVLMDIQMPVMDGLTAIRHIREQEAATGAARTPVLVLSANAMPEHLAASKAAGADDHVAKPVTAAGLITALQTALAGAEAAAANAA